MHAAKGWQHHDTENDDMLQSLEGQLLGLVLKRIAEFWDIGALFEGEMPDPNSLIEERFF
jgi:hypothetical protein